ncbi:hypothetical protein Lfu02_03680 [Longispora fulva]|uniref:Uncharacterized protein n=1 Tax=Longispora fulva TaxID=619741 RepID=A0A8J7GPU5_9ACTN|nr:hypothetical protein [Longispora fulva]MBG6135763.1 hypothetical protein [Longispora fulva]GIG55996.1 hypothetical protein Lfu02_03680 [Longispora fulva]
MDIREIFAARLADLPPSAVDLDRAVNDARHTRRTRRVLATVAASLCLVVAATVAVWGLPGSHAPAPPFAEGRSLREAPGEFNPRVQFAQLDWTPDLLPVRYIGASISSFHLASRPPTCPLTCGGPATDPDPAGRMSFTAFAAGAGDAMDVLAGEPVTTPAPAVHGAAAHWATRSNDSGDTARLRWQYAPHAWAQVEVRQAGDPREVAHRIADGARFATGGLIRLPVTAALADQRIESVELDTGDPWQATVLYRRAGTLGRDYTSVTVKPGTGHGGATVNTTVDGHPASADRAVDKTVGHDQVTVFDVRGLSVTVLATAREPGQMPAEGTAAAVFSGLTLYPDRADWQ